MCCGKSTHHEKPAWLHFYLALSSQLGIGERDIATRGARRSVVGVNFAIHPVGTHTKGKTDMNRVIRHALTGSALGSAMLLMASPAQAACTISATALNCAANTTVSYTHLTLPTTSRV